MTLYIIKQDNGIQKRVIEAIQDLTPWEDYEVEIRPHKRNKSRQQERYFHSLVDILCNFTGDDTEDMKRRITWACDLREDFSTQEGEVITVPRRTSGLKVGEYADIIKAAQMLCMELELKYPEPSHFGFA